MCGIFGSFGFSLGISREAFAGIANLLRHRGPDDQGFEFGTGWGLGFCRLSILDLSPTGHQPMYSPDGRFCLVFNGEIYNYLELREELQRQGESFRGSSDTEVLLRLLSQKGIEGLSRLNGMFALALIDTQNRTYLLARDRLGVKPLYYTWQNDQLRFASELKALLAWPDAQRQLDPVAVVQYLSLNYLPVETCIFQGYHKLQPGHVLVGSLDDPGYTKISSYWHLEINDQIEPESLPEQEFEETVSLLESAVKLRLRSDVPVGIFLSGGLDSGLVTAFAARSGQAQKLLALTVGFSERQFDEASLASRTAQFLGLEHRILQQHPAQLADIDRLAWYYDEPFGDSSALPTFLLCEAAARYATVFLSGDGGDELFGGYRWYMQGQRLGLFARFPEASHQILNFFSNFFSRFSMHRYRLLKLGLPDNGFAAAFDNIPNDPAIEFVIHPDLKHYSKPAGDPIWRRWSQHKARNLTARQQALDFALYLPDDILTKVDRASMAHSIEVRSPFLDYRLVERVAKWPRNVLCNTKEGKLPLRKLGEKLLPVEVKQGVKRGFGVPLDEWFTALDGQAIVRERLLSSQARQRNLWDIGAVEKILEMHVSGKGRRYGELLWRLLFLDAWARQYLDQGIFWQVPSQVSLSKS